MVTDIELQYIEIAHDPLLRSPTSLELCEEDPMMSFEDPQSMNILRYLLWLLEKEVKRWMEINEELRLIAHIHLPALFLFLKYIFLYLFISYVFYVFFFLMRMRIEVALAHSYTFIFQVNNYN